jgi:hypothetical protein
VILPGVNPLIAAIGLLGFALLENLLMSGHALIYSYDRLKGVQLLALFVAWAALARPARAWVVHALAALAGVGSLVLFELKYDTEHGFSHVPHSEQQLIGGIIRTTAAPAAPAFFSHEVRGSEVYYAGRNLIEHTPIMAEMRGLTTEDYIKKWCEHFGFKEATYYLLSGLYPYPRPADLPRTLTVYRVHLDRPSEQVGRFTLPEKWDDYHAQYDFMLEPLFKE